MDLECWCCGREPTAWRTPTGGHVQRPWAMGLCRRCRQRWKARGYEPPGPGPERTSQAEQAAEYADVITSLSATQAALRVGVSARTVVRWRKHLREVS